MTEIVLGDEHVRVVLVGIEARLVAFESVD